MGWEGFGVPLKHQLHLEAATPALLTVHSLFPLTLVHNEEVGVLTIVYMPDSSEQQARCRILVCDEGYEGTLRCCLVSHGHGVPADSHSGSGARDF